MGDIVVEPSELVVVVLAVFVKVGDCVCPNEVSTDEVVDVPEKVVVNVVMIVGNPVGYSVGDCVGNGVLPLDNDGANVGHGLGRDSEKVADEDGPNEPVVVSTDEVVDVPKEVVEVVGGSVAKKFVEIVGGSVGPVGEKVGKKVGNSVGAGVGLRVGGLVGAGVGLRVGGLVGGLVGAGVGLRVGGLVGAGVGLRVGGLVGGGVGLLVGDGVGSGVGDPVGSGVRTGPGVPDSAVTVPGSMVAPGWSASATVSRSPVFPATVAETLSAVNSGSGEKHSSSISDSPSVCSIRPLEEARILPPQPWQNPTDRGVTVTVEASTSGGATRAAMESRKPSENGSMFPQSGAQTGTVRTTVSPTDTVGDRVGGSVLLFFLSFLIFFSVFFVDLVDLEDLGTGVLVGGSTGGNKDFFFSVFLSLFFLLVFLSFPLLRARASPCRYGLHTSWKPVRIRISSCDGLFVGAIDVPKQTSCETRHETYQSDFYHTGLNRNREEGNERKRQDRLQL